jgi:hypothetical protein
VTVHLGTTYNRRDVYVYARPLGPATPAAGPGALIGHVRVNSAGNVVLGYVMRARTTFTVRFAGDYRYLAAARAVTVQVRTRMAIRTSGYSKVSRGVYYFRSSRAYFRATAAPQRRTGCIEFEAQIYLGGRWRAAGGACALTQPAYGYDAFGYARRIYVGYRFRVRAFVTSNAYSLGGTTAWMYFTFA